MSAPLQDPRFAHLSWDPKFNRVPKRERKVKIDERFKSMFTESKFQSKTKIDKRGRPLKRTTTEDLKRYYDLPSDDESKSSDEKEEQQQKEKQKNIEKPKKKKLRKFSQNDETTEVKSNSEESGDESDVSDEIHLDLARGDGNFASSSSENDSDEEWSFDDDEKIPEHEWGELDSEAKRGDQATRRLAVCNMDWDRIKAKDLLVVFNSFKPPLGMIRSVAIYPSEFGLRRMEEERVAGPKELLRGGKSTNEDDESSSDDDDSSNDDKNDEEKVVYRENLRRYQLNRLKYYYAVIECDTIETANSIYDACDGIEYESSATKIDLRFIPDDMTFDEALLKDEAKELGDLSSYKPTLFRNAALQQSKVELTWEEPDVRRRELVKQAFDENGLDSLPIDNLLAPCSSDEDGEQNDNATSTSLAFSKHLPRSPSFDEPSTPVVEKTKKKKKKPEKKKSLKKKLDDDEHFTVDIGDPRFAALYTSHLYNIDPSDPAYKKTKNMDALVREKLNRKEEKPTPTTNNDVSDVKISSQKNSERNKNISDNKPIELSLLVKSLKSKTEVWQRSKNKQKQINKLT